MESGAVVSRPACHQCGWPVDEVFDVVSRHPTSAGVVVYARCVCGVLRVWLDPTGSAGRLLTQAARPAGPVALVSGTPLSAVSGADPARRAESG